MENRRKGASIRLVAPKRARGDPPRRPPGHPGVRDGVVPGRSRGRIIDAIQKRFLRLGLLFLISCVASTAPAAATRAAPAAGGGECAIRDVNLRKKSPELAVDFRVSGAFDRKLEETIQSGLPRTLSFRVELYRPRLLLPDRSLGAWRLDHTIRYDNLKDEFLITRTVTAGEGGAPRRLAPMVRRGLAKASAAASTVEAFPVPLSESPAPVRYLLRIRAFVEPLEGDAAHRFGRVPLPLLPAFGRRKSDWYVQEFEF